MCKKNIKMDIYLSNVLNAYEKLTSVMTRWLKIIKMCKPCNFKGVAQNWKFPKRRRA